MQNGCLVQTCKSGKVEESLAEECVELIEKRVEEILEEKLKGKFLNLTILIMKISRH